MSYTHRNVALHALMLITPLVALLAASEPGVAEPAAAGAPYKGKQIVLVVGSSPGGGFDSYSRLLARHLGRHIAGEPGVIVQNMDGAGGLRAVNYIYNIAPKDGTVLGTAQRAALIEPLFGSAEAHFDAHLLSWVGSLNTEWSVAVAGNMSGLGSLADARARSFPVAASGTTSDDYIYPIVLNNVLGTKFKLVAGYPGTNEERLAVERGEVAGMIGWAWSAVKSRAGDLLAAGKLRVLLSLAPEQRPGLEQVPTVYDYAADAEQRRLLDFVFAPQIIGRPYFAPPGIPPDRLAALRAAFDATVRDADFLADAAAQKLELDPVGAEMLERRVDALYATPPEIVEKAKAARKYHAPTQ